MCSIGFLAYYPRLVISLVEVDPTIAKTINMRYIKLAMAFALVACLLPMPYGYYTLVRFVSMAIFAFFAFSYYEKKAMPLVFTFCALALLFQPFIKLALGRNIWNVVDIAVAIFLIVLYCKERINK